VGRQQAYGSQRQPGDYVFSFYLGTPDGDLGRPLPDRVLPTRLSSSWSTIVLVAAAAMKPAGDIYLGRKQLVMAAASFNET
jgi:hypothetical protein